VFYRKTIITILVAVVFALGAWAQTSPPHHHPDMVVVDGAKNPELIPDATAYRLWLITVSELPTATVEDRNRQKAHLAVLNLTTLDNLQLTTILADFKGQYLSLIGRYNEAATAALAHGEHLDQTLFLQQRDDLVSATRTAIASRMSPQSVALLNAHIQDEKKHIQLHTTKGAVQ